MTTPLTFLMVIASSPLVASMTIVSACAVASRCAKRSAEIDRDVLHVRAGEVVDVDGVGAAQRVDLEVLDIVQYPW